MINPNHGLSLTRQAELLELSRASLYYEPVGTSDGDLQLMRRLDELHLQWLSTSSIPDQTVILWTDGANSSNARKLMIA
jgi:hypothetical protein